MDKCLKFNFIQGNKNDCTPYKITPRNAVILDIYQDATQVFVPLQSFCYLTSIGCYRGLAIKRMYKLIVISSAPGKVRGANLPW